VNHIYKYINMILTIVLATANRDKVAEITKVFQQVSLPVELLDRPGHVPEVEETGSTLEENARLKARALVDATGKAALADDTGLEVFALEGAPGVRSSRYAGEHASYADNVAKLLRELDQVDDRRARFRTVALLAFPDDTELLAEGVVSGMITRIPKGNGGFGYDPVFLPNGGGGLTFAEMSVEQKNSISHRGLAFKALADRLSEMLGS
jgi:XTP/dITP diphosphohydrolase